MCSRETTLLIGRRLGFTVIELAVVLAIIGVLGASIGLLLMRQQRFYRGTSELIATRQSVRDAIEVLATDIRGMSAADTVRLLADSAIEFFSSIGSSVACQAVSANQVGLPPAGGGKWEEGRGSLTSFATQPDTGDLAVFYVDSGLVSERWHRYRILGFSSRTLATTCPASSGFSTYAQEASAAKAFSVSLDAPLNAGIHAGSPVQFVRRGRYSLYRASDGDWYLGYRRCNAIGPSVCGPIQPLSGPYRPYNRDVTQSGLGFEYFDRSGATVQTPLSLSRVDIVARAAGRPTVSLEGRTWTPRDSARVSVAVRNRLE
ncbi:MAG TPA: type II secretion system protein [Gemmatimonadaceae bacterium]|nr:type II secretion system protein [Gemmatimonadaceae bacterium]